jgi:hypothetical protein
MAASSQHSPPAEATEMPQAASITIEPDTP